ncbi:hypothetical protein NL676_035228 [Syzygium grande]|nr:hypothetical protein NL676_035228 [Syzygium grande]
MAASPSLSFSISSALLSSQMKTHILSVISKISPAESDSPAGPDLRPSPPPARPVASARPVPTSVVASSHPPVASARLKSNPPGVRPLTSASSPTPWSSPPKTRPRSSLRSS